MKILITGGAGFIGSHLTDRLLKENFQVICVDNFDNYYSPDEKKQNISQHTSNIDFELVKGDITDKELVAEALSIYKPHIVIHLAVRPGVSHSIQKPDEYLQTNIAGTLNVLEAMRIYQPKKFIYASSSCVYGLNEKTPFTETDHIALPASPFAATKIAAEALCYSYSHLYQINTSILRFFTVYGSRQRPDLAIRKFMWNILMDKEIQIYGKGFTLRDYTHVSDIVTGIRKAMDYTAEEYSVFNIGNSSPIKLIDLISKIETVLGKKAKLKFIDKNHGEMPVTFADITKAQKILGYNPETELDAGLHEMARWIKTITNKVK